MTPSRIPQNLRYFDAVRRAKLARIAAAGAIVVIPAACSSGDAGVFESALDASTAVEVTVAHTADATAPANAAADESTATTGAPTTEVPTTTEAPVAATSAFPAGGELVVDFTYTAEGGGRVRNPYVAVWVENEAGELVNTIGLWFLQNQKGTRWLNHLSNWSSVYGGETVNSGATRSPGAYSVAWNGTDVNGAAVAAGNYTLFIESAREHGPHSITSSMITIGAEGFNISLPDSGELNGLTAALNV